MDKIKKIECPSCGANSVFKLSTGEYKCNYCQTEFLVEEEHPDIHADLYKKLNEIKARNQKTSADSSQGKKLGLVIAMAILIFISGILGFVFLSAQGPVKKALNGEWQQPSLSSYIAFAGSKGPVIWEMLEYSRSHLDSSKHVLRIIDARTGKILSEHLFGDITTWNDNFNYNKRLNNEFLLLRDTLYNGSEDGGLQAFDVYTGQRFLSNVDFEKRFSVLKDGIAKVDSRLYNRQYVFYTNSGDEFYYYPDRNFLRDKHAEDEAYKTDTITRRNFYLTDGKKCELYLITQKENHNERGVISDYYLNGYKNGNTYYRKQFKTLEKLGDNIYPRAQRLVSTRDYVILGYLSDFSKKAHPIVEKIDAHGKSVWQNHDTALAALVNDFSRDNLHLNYTTNTTWLVLYTGSSHNRSVGIDLFSGKTSFVHTQGHNLELD